MKKKTSISFVVLATLILFTLSIFPHHHHEGVPCIVTAEKDHPNKHDADHGHCCASDVPFIVSKWDEQITQEVVALNFLSLYFLVIPLPENTLLPLLTNNTNRHTFPFLYRSANVSHLNGLRAPPYLNS